MATVAGELKGFSCIFTVLAAVPRSHINPAIARRVLTLLRSFTHAKVSLGHRSRFRLPGLLNLVDNVRKHPTKFVGQAGGPLHLYLEKL
jgi:hypothetical protein